MKYRTGGLCNQRMDTQVLVMEGTILDFENGNLLLHALGLCVDVFLLPKGKFLTNLSLTWIPQVFC